MARQHGAGRLLLRRGRAPHDLQLVLRRRVVDLDLQHEAIELGFGQRVGALLLDRVLRREHEERRLDRVRHAADRDVLLLHRLQQRGLRLGGRAVDLVGEDDVGEHRAGHEPEARWPLCASCSSTSVPVMSVGIRSGVNWMRLNLSEQRLRQAGDEQRLGQARHADQQAMALANSAISSCSMTWSWPTMRRRSCSTICCRASARRATSSTSSWTLSWTGSFMRGAGRPRAPSSKS